MSQDRLNGLEIMSTKNVIGKSLNFDQLIDNFLILKLEKRPLQNFIQISLQIMFKKYVCEIT